MVHSEKWINPYKAKLVDFPERIFDFDSFDEDVARFKKLAEVKSLIVELGSGSGAHLIEVAKRNPEALVVGFEIRFKRAVRTIEKALQKDVNNCIVLRQSYNDLERILPKHSIDQLYINFPDPWAKKKQRKHRILGVELLNLLPVLLSNRGFVSVKTDHEEYFTTFENILLHDSRYSILERSRDLYASKDREEIITTEFEQLFVNKGCPIYHISFALA